ncbi:Eco57I restriction-modification methylase domain-containing protein [Alkaliphilus transvaalensis]|uniref:Eco57I restriction-modification methylase domain-containing protein n=1 Tax=Alkaliphilus transvaalensis TaxID=114628 RepID=UPI0004788380|nr:DNA methyltransferase [Alkaliphilus transvaalensis]
MKNSKLETLKETLENPFKIEQFIKLLTILFHKTAINQIEKQMVKEEAYTSDIVAYYNIGKYIDLEDQGLLILVIELKNLEGLNARKSIQRHFVSEILQREKLKSALVAFYVEGIDHWRLSYLKFDETFKGDQLPLNRPPMIRYSYLAGRDEPSILAQKQFFAILNITKSSTTIKQLEDAFSIEQVTKNFFYDYKNKCLELKRYFKDSNELILTCQKLNLEVDKYAEEYAKKLMGYFSFLYFLQKKGWLGVEKTMAWGNGSKTHLRDLYYETLGEENGSYYLNKLRPLLKEILSILSMQVESSQLFEEENEGKKWLTSSIGIPNDFFSKGYSQRTVGTGVLDIFERYNFTLKEDEPYEKEIAVDPEMLGKVFENLLQEVDRKSKGVFYTPREIVHYMSQEGLIHYLSKKLKLSIQDLREFVLFGDLIKDEDFIKHKKSYEKIIYKSENIKGEYLLKPTIQGQLLAIDDALKSVKIADPAVGSGAFPLGILSEIVKIRNVITEYIHMMEEESNLKPCWMKENKTNYKERSLYHLKKETIKNSIYAVDIDPRAVEITKLRLWLSLVVEQEVFEGFGQPEPLPNLDMNIYVGNSLLGQPFNEETDAGIISKREEQLTMDFQQILPNSRFDLLEENLKDEKQSSDDFKQLVWQEIFVDIYKKQKGFDIIIGNPPYVGEKGNKEIFRRIANTDFGRRFYQGKMDLFYFFFHKALEIGNDDAVIAFITTNYFPTANGAYKLRADLKERSNIIKLINFNELRIFESALGQHNLISIFEKKKIVGKPQLAEIMNVNKQGYGNESVIKRILHGNDKESNYSLVENDKLYEGDQLYIRIVDEENQFIRRALRKISNGTNLANFCHINQGIVSGADKLTSKHIEKYSLEGNKNDGIFVLADEEVKKLNLTEKEGLFLKPFFKNSDIMRYYSAKKTNKQIIYIDREIKSIDDLCPNLWLHLEKYAPILRDRREARNGVIEFFHLQWSRKERIFLEEKIIAPQRSRVNTFGYNEIPWYSSADVYYITKKDNPINLKYLLGLLNSKLYYIWFYFRGKRKGEVLELYQTPLKETPVLIDHRVEGKLTDLVTRMLHCNDGLVRTKLQSSIDQLVYGIYSLEEAEIKAIEDFVNEKPVADYF